MSDFPGSDQFIEPAIALVDEWLRKAEDLETRQDRATMSQLGDLVADEEGVGFVMKFVDRVARPDDNKVAASQLAAIVASEDRLPKFLSPIDKAMLTVGAKIAPLLPAVVIPLAQRRMRSIVGHLVAPADPVALGKHLGTQREDGYDLNVNMLGEAVLGEKEANARLQQLIGVLEVPDVDYVSVKLSAIASQINHWSYQSSLERVSRRLADLVDAASAVSPPTFINFDMEEYHDLELTVDAFKRVLDEPNRQHLDAGIVLQAYLPDVFAILQDLVSWSNARNAVGGGTVKIRLVKGANLAMEKVDAAMHGWPQAPFSSKIESDASYRRCLDWVLTEENLSGTRLGLASHNLFDVAWAKLVADSRDVADRVQFEMLQGMAPGQAKAVNLATASDAAGSMLLYTPAVSDDDFDVAIGYLFRRLEENAAPENFMRKLFDLKPGSKAFDDEAAFFRKGAELRHSVDLSVRRTQNRSAPSPPHDISQRFRNEPDTDPNLPANRAWIESLPNAPFQPCRTELTETVQALQFKIDQGRSGAAKWAAVDPAERRVILHRVGDELAKRRGDFISTMMHEASKTISEGDNEVSEAIDFARWYADRGVELNQVDGASFDPHGLVAVVPPWNFPTAIVAGGVLSSLAAGNGVILKPAPETPRTAEIVAEACWAGGVPVDAMQFVRTPDNEVGQHLVESADAVILTGSTETADLFRSWNPKLKLYAETSGKNALIITPSADLDLAAEHLVRSAFGHAGQKCSAASLAILVGDVATSDRFRRQLRDAVTSLGVGSPTDLDTDIAPLVGGVNDRLGRASETLEPGESWLVEPKLVDGAMSPGVRDGVKVGSWFHQTECFGPVLGLMAAESLDDAIGIANSSSFGLTGGIHTLDPNEAIHWAERIEIGNGYVNRPITGAIVQRQPFGGWKRSSVGPGAKAGGPNYLMQLGIWTADESLDDDYQQQWNTHFSRSHDDTALFCEANIFRYRALPAVGVCLNEESDPAEVALVRKAAAIAGVPVTEIRPESSTSTSWVKSMRTAGIERVRMVGVEVTPEMASAANELGVRLADEAVTPAGRVELQHYVREQAMSVTLHRFGNLVGAEKLANLP